jgi:glycosylphosphatidylinositol transamidase (GPIT) subunit GPI8
LNTRFRCGARNQLTTEPTNPIPQMHRKGRYKELLLVVETCQAATLYSRIK